MAETVILGGGVTGLAAGFASGLAVYEAEAVPGGICASYYMRPGDSKRLYTLPSDREVYRFEIGGGHWIFGGDPAVLHFIHRLTPTRSYSRNSSVYFPHQELFVPFPIQNHLSYLPREVAAQALAEMVSASASPKSYTTMAEWLQNTFGETLYRLFFEPFHRLYTAGLFEQIAPQDAYKSPVNMAAVIKGALTKAPAAGYNVTFVYPTTGLNNLVQRMAEQAHLRLDKRVVAIDLKLREIYFSDGSSLSYKYLISTLPLTRILDLTGLAAEEPPDPYTSVLVLNLGARKGARCPNYHWVYLPCTRSGFHRVGFYSNVDVTFLPVSAWERDDRVSIYVERAYRGGVGCPTREDLQAYCEAVVRELQEWQFIQELEVLDVNWIEVAYTWTWPGSTWRKRALDLLEQHAVYQVGRYGRWVFQGIADSMRDGFMVGAIFKGQ